MATSYAEADDDVDINEPIIMDDISDQQVSDVIDPARKVPFIIKKASIRHQRADAQDKASQIEVTRLVIDAAIEADGVDTEGKYANKHLFSELVLSFNRETHVGDWWEKSSRGPTKQFFLALGFDLKAMPPIDGEFLSELGGREFIADITRKPIQKKTDRFKENGKAVYEDTGDFKNELANFRTSA